MFNSRETLDRLHPRGYCSILTRKGVEPCPPPKHYGYMHQSCASRPGIPHLARGESLSRIRLFKVRAKLSWLPPTPWNFRQAQSKLNRSKRLPRHRRNEQNVNRSEGGVSPRQVHRLVEHQGYPTRGNLALFRPNIARWSLLVAFRASRDHRSWNGYP